MSKMRLDKFLCEAGVGSRSQVKSYIKAKRIQVNNCVFTDCNGKIDPDADIITYNNSVIYIQQYEYFLLNKPKGMVSATTDNLHKTVIDLITTPHRKDIFPVGRLDIDTEGLLLITNDGELAHQLLSPKKHVDKTYYATIDGLISSSDIVAFREGLDIGEEALTLPAVLEIVDTYIPDSNPVTSYTNITVTIHEGKFHQVKRMFNAIGRNVLYLKRLSMGNIELGDTLQPGEYRPLTIEEIENLKTN